MAEPSASPGIRVQTGRYLRDTAATQRGFTLLDMQARESMTAILLLQADHGMAATVHERLADLPGVDDAAATTGPYDVIVQVTAESERSLRGVLDRVRAVPGLCRLGVCRLRSAAH
jgi:Lrp/AsnC ligand binding domain